MVGGDLVIYALLIGLAVGILIGRCFPNRRAADQVDERIFIVLAPSIRDGQMAAEAMLATLREVEQRAPSRN